MPIIDFNEVLDFDGDDFDIVIVGAGAAGLYLASRIASRLRTLVIETGHADIDEERQRLNEVMQTGKPLAAAVWGRKRAIGGTTTVWGGQSLPFSRIDFEQREWVQESAWPISRDQLNPHYRAANRAMGIDEIDYDQDIFTKLKYKPPDVDDEKIYIHVSKWAREPDFSKIFSKDIDLNVTLLYNCQLVHIALNDDGTTSIEVASFKTQRSKFRVRRLVLAAGALETNRILLDLDRRTSCLTPAQRSLLGTGFMDHPCADVGEVEVERPYAFQRMFNTHVWQRRKYSIRLSAAEELQRQRRILNASASIMMMPAGADFDPYTEFRNFSKLFSQPGRNIARTLVAGAATAKALAADGFIYKHGAEARLCIMCEQEPLRSSRLSLSSEPDRFGVPKLCVHWEVSDLSWKSTEILAETIRDEFDRLGLGKVRLRQELLDGTGGTHLLTDVNHHMGGTVMGTDPDASVVDPDLRLHAVPSISVCSTSVFPSSSHSNPTLTLLALADRLAGQLLAG